MIVAYTSIESERKKCIINRHTWCRRVCVLLAQQGSPQSEWGEGIKKKSTAKMPTRFTGYDVVDSRGVLSASLDVLPPYRVMSFPLRGDISNHIFSIFSFGLHWLCRAKEGGPVWEDWSSLMNSHWIDRLAGQYQRQTVNDNGAILHVMDLLNFRRWRTRKDDQWVQPTNITSLMSIIQLEETIDGYGSISTVDEIVHETNRQRENDRQIKAHLNDRPSVLVTQFDSQKFRYSQPGHFSTDDGQQPLFHHSPVRHPARNQCGSLIFHVNNIQGRNVNYPQLPD